MEYKVAFWNTGNNVDDTQVEEFSNVRSVVQNLIDQSYDCIFLQESMPSSQDEHTDCSLPIYKGYKTIHNCLQVPKFKESGQTLYLKEQMTTPIEIWTEGFNVPMSRRCMQTIALHNNPRIVIGSLHGVSGLGKNLLPRNISRDQIQKDQNRFISKQLNAGDSEYVMFGGDLNYSRQIPALKHLEEQEVFGGKSLNLNTHFGLEKTRTTLHEGKCKQADWVIVSDKLAPYIKSMVLIDEVAADHSCMCVTIEVPEPHPDG